MTVILYARVSTADQTLEHQEIQARAAGFDMDQTIADHAASGLNTKLRDRPEGKRLYDMLRSGDVLVVRWLDRLGRNYQDVCETMRYFLDRGVTIRTVINNMTFDGKTSDPVQMAVRDALIGFMAAMAQAQAEATKEAQKAGIAHARAKEDGRYLGRKPAYNRESYQAVRDMLGRNEGVSAIARATGLTRQSVLRIRDNPDRAEATLIRWGM